MHPTNYTLDKFVAKDVSKFTQHSLKPIIPDFPQHCYWLSNCVLNSIFTSSIPDNTKPGIFSIIRKGEHTLSEYEIAFSYLEKFLKNGRKISDYFRV